VPEEGPADEGKGDISRKRSQVKRCGDELSHEFRRRVVKKGKPI